MPVLLARIDDRLIHGQVVVGWAQALKIDHIVVVNDEIVKNDMQKFLFRMATPTDINLSIFTVQEAAEKLRNRFFDNENVMMLFKSPADVYNLLKCGGKIGEINVGGMHFAENKIQLFDAIFVDSYDVEMFEKIKAFNVALEVRMVPTDTKKDLFKAIEEKFYKKNKG
ncbi:MAG: PTS sugar transporter subunit IIB [Candidatus Goldbacteria bacterium]|nr:PTS sugar transporter subunit IIB [Candidatus Goldiibacteriota bacterium]